MAYILPGRSPEDRRVGPTARAEPSKLSLEEFLQEAKGRTTFTKARNEPSVRKLWEVAVREVIRGWLAGPFRYTVGGCPLTRGRKSRVDPAFCFGVRQADNLRAVGDMMGSFNKQAALLGPRSPALRLLQL